MSKNEKIPGQDAELIMLQFDRKDIESFDIMDICETLSEFVENPDKYFNKIAFYISGYDKDPRELWEIKEVRDFFFFLDNAFPYWFFWIKNDMPFELSPLNLFIPCICPLESVKRRKGKSNTIFEKKNLLKVIKDHFHYFNLLANQSNIPEEDILKAVTNINNIISKYFLKIAHN